MAVYAYQGTGARGEKRTGELEAVSRSEALRKLATERIQPLSLVAKADVVETKAGKRVTSSTAPGKVAAVTGGMRLNAASVILFTDELADFLNSGLQLEPALQLMERREDKSPVKNAASFLREKVRDGTNFSEALRACSPDFDDLYCNLVAAGEASGALAPLLRRQSMHLLAMQDLKNRVTLALIYPSALVLAGVAAMAVFMIVLVPQMTKLFAKTGSAMPTPTYLLIQLSNATHRYGLIAVALGAILITGFMVYIRQPNGRRWWDQAKLHIPLLGGLLSSAFYAQFCQTMSNLLQNGLPLLAALKLATGATGNIFYRSLLYKIADLVGEGTSLTRAMKSVGTFPPNLRDLVKVGEQTGDLGTTLEKVGQRYEKGVQLRIDRIMSVVPLIIISVLGVVVVLIAWSMLEGIFTAMHGLQGHH